MKITLAPREKLHVDFVDTDGEFIIHFDTSDFPNAVVVEETAGCKPSVVGATGIIFHDEFVPVDLDDVDCILEHSSELDVAIPVPAKTKLDAPDGFFVIKGQVQSTRVLQHCAVVNRGTASRPLWWVEVYTPRTREVTGEFKLFLTAAEANARLDAAADFPNIVPADDPLTECARNEELGRRESLDAD